MSASPKSIILAENQLPKLHTLILAEVFLAGGPVDIYRLWSEMYERQETIDVGMLLFTRAIVHLEDNGYLNKVSEMKSELAGKGEMHLMGLLLCDQLPKEVEKRFQERGIQLIREAVAYESGTGVVANRKPLTNTNGDTQILYENTNTYRGDAVTPVAPLKTFTCQRNGIDGFISAMDSVIDRAQEAEDLGGYPDPASDPRFA